MTSALDIFSDSQALMSANGSHWPIYVVTVTICHDKADLINAIHTPMYVVTRYKFIVQQLDDNAIHTPMYVVTVKSDNVVAFRIYEELGGGNYLPTSNKGIEAH